MVHFSNFDTAKLGIREVSKAAGGSMLFKLVYDRAQPLIQTPFWEIPFDVRIRPGDPAYGGKPLCSMFMNLDGDVGEEVQGFRSVVDAVDARCQELLEGFADYGRHGVKPPSGPTTWKSSIRTSDKYGDSWSPKLGITRTPEGQEFDLDLAVITTPTFNIHGAPIPEPKVIPARTRLCILVRPAYFCRLQHGGVSVAWFVHQILVDGVDLEAPTAGCDFEITHTIQDLRSKHAQDDGGGGPGGHDEDGPVADGPVAAGARARLAEVLAGGAKRGVETGGSDFGGGDGEPPSSRPRVEGGFSGAQPRLGDEVVAGGSQAASFVGGQ